MADYSNIRMMRSESNQNSSERDRVMERIRSASATDADIDFVKNHGTSSMVREMQQTANRLYQDKKHIERLYGAGFADGKDRNGNYVKVMDVNI